MGIWQAFVGSGMEVEIVGVDHRPQIYYPFRIIEADVLEFTKRDLWWEGYDFVAASPPCQAYSWAAQSWTDNHNLPRLIPITRERLNQTGLPYYIENVQGAPLRRDAVRLCGEMFGLGVIRHRLFETNWLCPEPRHIPHKRAVVVPNRKWKRSAYCQVAGHGGDGRSYKLRDWQEAMGIDWIADRQVLAEAVPPAYSCYILQQFRNISCQINMTASIKPI